MGEESIVLTEGVTRTLEEGEVDLTKHKLSDEDKEFKKVMEGYSSQTEMLRDIYQKSLQRDPNAKCPSCGGKPFAGETCKVCDSGAVLDKLFLTETVPAEQKDALFIPTKYHSEKFQAHKLIENHTNLKDSKSFNKYVKYLDRILAQTETGSLQLSSLYIHAPSGFGKETFAYTLLQVGMLAGLTVFPYLDLSEVSRLITAYESGNRKDDIVKSIGYSDVDLYTAELCVLKVPHFDSLNSYKVMLAVIDRRARRGLPTIILSRYSYKYFTSFDTYKEVDGILGYDNVSPKNLRVVEMDAKLR